MNEYTKNKYFPFVAIFVSKLIVVLISSFIVKKMILLIIKNYNKIDYLIIIVMIILTIILTIFSVIACIINYQIIKLFFLGSNFNERMKVHEFLSVNSLASLFNSLLLLVIFCIINFVSGFEFLKNNWSNISKVLITVFNLFTLCIIGIYIKKKINYKSTLICVIICLIPYTCFNCIGWAVKYFL